LLLISTSIADVRAFPSYWYLSKEINGSVNDTQGNIAEIENEEKILPVMSICKAAITAEQEFLALECSRMVLEFMLHFKMRLNIVDIFEHVRSLLVRVVRRRCAWINITESPGQQSAENAHPRHNSITHNIPVKS